MAPDAEAMVLLDGVGVATAGKTKSANLVFGRRYYTTRDIKNVEAGYEKCLLLEQLSFELESCREDIGKPSEVVV